MRSKIVILIKGVSYHIPLYIKKEKGCSLLEQKSSINFYSNDLGTGSTGVDPTDLIHVLGLYVSEQEYPQEKLILELLDGVDSLIRVSQKHKGIKYGSN